MGSDGIEPRYQARRFLLLFFKKEALAMAFL